MSEMSATDQNSVTNPAELGSTTVTMPVSSTDHPIITQQRVSLTISGLTRPSSQELHDSAIFRTCQAVQDLFKSGENTLRSVLERAGITSTDKRLKRLLVNNRFRMHIVHTEAFNEEGLRIDFWLNTAANAQPILMLTHTEARGKKPHQTAEALTEDEIEMLFGIFITLCQRTIRMQLDAIRCAAEATGDTPNYLSPPLSAVL